MPGAYAAVTALCAEAETPSAPGEAQAGILPDLVELAVSKKEELEAFVDANMARITPEDLSALQSELERDPMGPYADVSAAIQVSVEARMASAKEALENLINNNSGDVNAQIKKTLRGMETPLPLLMVLQMNIEQCRSTGEEDKLRAMLHINTVVNEELEKKVSRVRGMINRLLRLEDPGVRGNILRHHLAPMPVVGAPDLDDFGDGEVDSSPQLTAALVPPPRLASAISEVCGEIDRQMRAAGPEANDALFDTLERIRTVAKEARLVVGELYGPAEMGSFGADLTPAFNSLMVHKQAAQQQAAEEAAQRQAAEEAAAGPAAATPDPGPAVPFPTNT